MEGKSFFSPDFFIRKNLSSLASINSLSLSENAGSSVLGDGRELHSSYPSIKDSEHLK